MAARARPQTRTAAADGARPLRLERRAHVAHAVGERFVRLHFGQRLNASTRFFLGRGDPALRTRLTAGTAGDDGARGNRRANHAGTPWTSHVAPPAFFLGPARPPP